MNMDDTDRNTIDTFPWTHDHRIGDIDESLIADPHASTPDLIHQLAFGHLGDFFWRGLIHPYWRIALEKHNHRKDVPKIMKKLYTTNISYILQLWNCRCNNVDGTDARTARKDTLIELQHTASALLQKFKPTGEEEEQMKSWPTRRLKQWISHMQRMLKSQSVNRSRLQLKRKRTTRSNATHSTTQTIAARIAARRAQTRRNTRKRPKGIAGTNAATPPFPPD